MRKTALLAILCLAVFLIGVEVLADPTLEVRNDTLAIKGAATSTTGNTGGVYGVARSSSGRGVFGEATSTTGTTYGVVGRSRSSSGRGVFGTAPRIGLQGTATSTTGTTAGVHGRSRSSSGRGVFGIATSTTGTTAGVYGTSSSSTGRGVHGEAPFIGLYGNATGTGTNYGVYGQSASTVGRGVYGTAPLYGLEGYATGTGINYGVYGESRSPSGGGVYGTAPLYGLVDYATSTTAPYGQTLGVYGQSDSTAGRGVYGLASSTTGGNYGVFGQSASTAGVGVYGSTAGTYGLYTPDSLYVGGKINVVGAVDPIVGERFTADPNIDYEVGDLLVIDENSPYVKPCSKEDDTRIIGVVGPEIDIKEGEIMVVVGGYQGAKPEKNIETGETPNRIIVKVRADASYSPIKRGDLLTTSPNRGHAMKAQPVDFNGIEIYKPGTLLGKALEPLESGKGLISVFVTLQ